MNQQAAGNATLGPTEESVMGFLSWLVNSSNDSGWLRRLVMPTRRRRRRRSDRSSRRSSGPPTRTSPRWRRRTASTSGRTGPGHMKMIFERGLGALRLRIRACRRGGGRPVLRRPQSDQGPGGCRARRPARTAGARPRRAEGVGLLGAADRGWHAGLAGRPAGVGGGPAGQLRPHPSPSGVQRLEPRPPGLRQGTVRRPAGLAGRQAGRPGCAAGLGRFPARQRQARTTRGTCAPPRRRSWTRPAGCSAGCTRASWATRPPAR